MNNLLSAGCGECISLRTWTQALWGCCLSGGHSLPGAFETKSHKPSGLEQFTFTVSQFRRLEAQIHGVGRAIFPLEVGGPFHLSSLLETSGIPRLINGCLLPVSLHLILPMCTSVVKFPAFIRMSITGLRANPNDLNLTGSSAKTLFVIKVTFTDTED